MYFRLSLPADPAFRSHHHTEKSAAAPVHTEASHRLLDFQVPQKVPAVFQIYFPTVVGFLFYVPLIVCPIVKLVSDDRSGLLPAPVSRCIPVLPPFHPLP